MNKKEFLINKSKEFIESRKIYFNYVNEYNSFSSSLLKDTKSLLYDFNTVFQWERKGNTREGALTRKNINQKIGDINLLVKVIKVRKDVKFISQIHTYFHELTHLVCNHNNQEYNNLKLTRAQKEYVAEVTAQALFYSFVGGKNIKDLPYNGKWDASTYIQSWVNNGRFSNISIGEMWRQIEYAYKIISNTIKNSD